MTAGPARNNREIESPLVVLPINLSSEFPCVELEMRLFKRQKLGFMLKSTLIRRKLSPNSASRS